MPGLVGTLGEVPCIVAGDINTAWQSLPRASSFALSSWTDSVREPTCSAAGGATQIDVCVVSRNMYDRWDDFAVKWGTGIPTHAVLLGRFETDGIEQHTLLVRPPAPTEPGNDVDLAAWHGNLDAATV